APPPRPTADESVGNHVHRSVRRLVRRDAAQPAATSYAAVRGWRRAVDFDFSARDGAQRASLCRTHLLALHAAVRGLALRHRILPRRRAWSGRHFLDVA